MPEILSEGIIKKGSEIGRLKSSYRNFRWSACEKCRRLRWVIVKIKNGELESKTCNHCAGDHLRGSNNWKWNNWGKSKHSSGYVYIHLHPDDFFYPIADHKGHVLEHRLVMAKSLGRNLHLWEIVHHKNHIRDDNQIENLQLVSDDKHKQLTMLEMKIDRLLAKQDELMTEIKLLRFENKQLKGKV